MVAETLTWIAPDGTEVLLSSGGALHWQRGLLGRGMPPIVITERELVVGDGSVLVQVRSGPVTVDVPIIVTGELRQTLRAAASAFNPHAGDGRLVTDIDGDRRELVCRYRAGLEWDEQLPHIMKQLLSFRAFSPYWQDDDDTTGSFGIGDLARWLPWPPIVVVADDVFAQATIVNTGDVEAWPVWTIRGPSDEVTLTSDTGARLRVAYPLVAGEILTIDTRPGAKTVVDQTGVNRFSSLDENDDDLYSFPVGTTTVTITIVGATAESEVGLAWRRRWLTA